MPRKNQSLQSQYLNRVAKANKNTRIETPEVKRVRAQETYDKAYPLFLNKVGQFMTIEASGRHDPDHKEALLAEIREQNRDVIRSLDFLVNGSKNHALTGKAIEVSHSLRKVEQHNNLLEQAKAEFEKLNEIQGSFKEQALDVFQQHLNKLPESSKKRNAGQEALDNLQNAQETLFNSLKDAINSGPTTKKSTANQALTGFLATCSEQTKKADAVMGNGWLKKAGLGLVGILVGLLTSPGLLLSSSYRASFKNTFFGSNESSKALQQVTDVATNRLGKEVKEAFDLNDDQQENAPESDLRQTV